MTPKTPKTPGEIADDCCSPVIGELGGLETRKRVYYAICTERERDELRKELEEQKIRWGNLPCQPDMDADENNPSPKDALAHQAGLAIKAIESALRAGKETP